MDFSPLNNLSAELRIRIYEFSLCTSGPLIHVFENTAHMYEGSHFIRPRTPQPYLLALARTCRQIRYEALPVFHAVNHFKIYAGHALGSSSREAIRPLAQKCFECYAAFGRYASCVGNFEISMGDSEENKKADSLEIRNTFIREIGMLFGRQGPLITMELDVSCGVTSTKRPHLCPIIREFPSVPPIRIELAHIRDKENRRAIERAVHNAKCIAVGRGYASRRYLSDLGERRVRALFVLRRLSQERSAEDN